jgi:sugar/nucleoside kinase (ribokinase family)
MDKLKVIVVNDFMGSSIASTEEEVVGILGELEENGIPVELKSHFDYFPEDLEIKPADIFVLDFGGLLPGADSLIVDAVRSAAEWAENHPGKLLVLWSSFTTQWYMNEAKHLFPELTNIVCRSFENELTFIDEIKRWFSIPE